LAQSLAQASDYPQREDFEICAKAGEWMDFYLLQWVCQHFQSLRRLQHKLYSTIEEAYTGMKPPAAYFAVAAWDVPGFICTYFDGMLALALKLLGKHPGILNAVDGKLNVAPDRPVLVHLRGIWTDTESLVLTEEDHDRLWDRMAKLPARVTDLLHGSAGRSLLFLGVHPRDPLAHRLCAKLLDRGISKRVGPVYFAHSDPTAVDEAYWCNYKVEWIRLTPDTVIQAIESALGQEAKR
jgi:hypothetical protein